MPHPRTLQTISGNGVAANGSRGPRTILSTPMFRPQTPLDAAHRISNRFTLLLNCDIWKVQPVRETEMVERYDDRKAGI